MFRRIIRILFKSLLAFLIIIGAYVMFAIVSALIPTNAELASETPSIEVYILKSGPHSDIFVPVKNEYHDFRPSLPYANNAQPDTNLHWLALGWGDKNFYMNTPTWGDLTAKTALSATFGLGDAAMHATFYYDVPMDREMIHLSLTSNQYLRLCSFIESSLVKQNERSVVILPTCEGINGDHDRYYEAHGTYSAVYTCNTWVNDGLKAAGQRACLWTGFVEGIFYQYNE